MVHDPLPWITRGKAAWAGNGALNDARSTAATSARPKTISRLIEIPPLPILDTATRAKGVSCRGGAPQVNPSKFSLSSGIDSQVASLQPGDCFEAAALVGGHHGCAAGRRKRCRGGPEAGGGRVRIDDQIDPSVGFIADVKIGSELQTDDLIGTVFSADVERGRRAAKRISSAYEIANQRSPELLSLIKEVIE